MPTSFQYDCPHCRTNKAAFTIRHQYYSRSIARVFFFGAVCGVCEHPISAQGIDTEIGIRTTSPVDLLAATIDFPSDRMKLIRIWPGQTAEAPENLPENIEKFFTQGIRNERAENWDAAGAMFRKALDVATKVLDPPNSGKPLFQRIEALAQAGRLTADLAAWAHEVRIEGNSSVHDDEPETSEDVAVIHQFARAVLLYTFTLPALVAARSTSPTTP